VPFVFFVLRERGDYAFNASIIAGTISNKSPTMP
jgi:hypothetical protein